MTPNVTADLVVAALLIEGIGAEVEWETDSCGGLARVRIAGSSAYVAILYGKASIHRIVRDMFIVSRQPSHPEYPGTYVDPMLLAMDRAVAAANRAGGAA